MVYGVRGNSWTDFSHFITNFADILDIDRYMGYKVNQRFGNSYLNIWVLSILPILTIFGTRAHYWPMCSVNGQSSALMSSYTLLFLYKGCHAWKYYLFYKVNESEGKYSDAIWEVALVVLRFHVKRTELLYFVQHLREYKNKPAIFYSNPLQLETYCIHTYIFDFILFIRYAKYIRTRLVGNYWAVTEPKSMLHCMLRLNKR